jgi:putative ABC transport system permease protein
MRRILTILLSFWDKSTRSFVLALRSLWLHKLRAILSVLGIIIGTAAVISLMAFGEGSMQDTLDDIARQGATNIIVKSDKPPDDASSQKRNFVAKFGLDKGDYERMKLLGDKVIEEHVPMRIIYPYEVRRANHMHISRIVATTHDYPKVMRVPMLMGRFLLDSDNFEGEGDDVYMRNVCVIGTEVAQALFPFESPLYQTVVINKQNFEVVGVVDERMPTGGSGGSQASERFNSDVYIPYRTALGRFGSKVYIRQSGARSGEEVVFSQITLKIREMGMVREAGNTIKAQLERYHQRKDWSVVIPLDRLEEAERARDRFTILLAVIAGISLLVGGIGIMNIMLATVTERTREIGIRRALGAKRRDIVMQFLIEALVQTSIGAAVGLLLGVAIVFTIPPLYELFFSKPLPAKLHVPSMFYAVGVSILTGVVFGLYPAWRASRLDPIEALRHE